MIYKKRQQLVHENLGEFTYVDGTTTVVLNDLIIGMESATSDDVRVISSL